MTKKEVRKELVEPIPDYRERFERVGMDYVVLKQCISDQQVLIKQMGSDLAHALRRIRALEDEIGTATNMARSKRREGVMF